MSWKRLWWGLVIAFVVFYIVKYPDQAADTVHSIGATIGEGFDKIAEFVRNL